MRSLTSQIRSLTHPSRSPTIESAKEESGSRTWTWTASQTSSSPSWSRTRRQRRSHTIQHSYRTQQKTRTGHSVVSSKKIKITPTLGKLPGLIVRSLCRSTSMKMAVSTSLLSTSKKTRRQRTGSLSYTITFKRTKTTRTFSSNSWCCMTTRSQHLDQTMVKKAKTII